MQIGWEVAMLVQSRDREVTTNAGQSGRGQIVQAVGGKD